MWLEWLKITHYTDFNQPHSVMEMSFSMSAKVYSELTIGLALKNYPKMTFLDFQNPSTGSKVMEMSFSMSADVYSNITIGLALKNYPKMTPDTLKSIQWI